MGGGFAARARGFYFCSGERGGAAPLGGGEVRQVDGVDDGAAFGDQIARFQFALEEERRRVAVAADAVFAAAVGAAAVVDVEVAGIEVEAVGVVSVAEGAAAEGVGAEA